MDPEEVKDRLASVRLQAALEEHIMATEEVPPEVRQAVQALFPQRPRSDSSQ
ncbi:hypothetical protein [Nonomuraea sp. PA05]|uniref:hypothetical protein n=1 Tax=Nonomuraea sp. PA05 TaxID=2604466 RepID=UPI0016523A46|nr:hypothetical protein [Nonomuraea sp. PA05]